jgi:hypothetical protein
LFKDEKVSLKKQEIEGGGGGGGGKKRLSFPYN